MKISKPEWGKVPPLIELKTFGDSIKSIEAAMSGLYMDGYGLNPLADKQDWVGWFDSWQPKAVRGLTQDDVWRLFGHRLTEKGHYELKNLDEVQLLRFDPHFVTWNEPPIAKDHDPNYIGSLFHTAETSWTVHFFKAPDFQEVFSGVLIASSDLK